VINRELIKQLLDYPLDVQVYVGKGMGPVGKVEETITDKIYVILSPKGTS
jgi:hypothetical protein